MTLRRFINIESDDDFTLLVGWLVWAMTAVGPFPVLGFQGEQSSCKTTATRLLVSLIDPNLVPLVPPPRDDRSLMAIADTRHVIAIDNITHLDTTSKDALCRLATGSGHIARKLYSDRDVVAWHACRPIILNGIDSYATADDLADRMICITLPPLPERLRRPESDLWRDYNAARGELLGALLDAMVTALQAAPITTPLPRMADFAQFAATASTAWGDTPEHFLACFKRNQQAAVNRGLDGDPVADGIRALVGDGDTWRGPLRKLLKHLEELDPLVTRSADWPRTARQFGNVLRRLAPAVRRAYGIEIAELGRHGSGRMWEIRPIHQDPGERSERTERSPLLEHRKEEREDGEVPEGTQRSLRSLRTPPALGGES